MQSILKQCLNECESCNVFKVITYISLNTLDSDCVNKLDYQRGIVWCISV